MTEDGTAQRSLAVACFNRVWELLDAPDRTPEQTDEMVDAAHASRHLWRGIGGVQEAVVGEWQVSRAYGAAALPEESLRHAHLALALVTGEGTVEQWVVASVFEGMARALAVAGRHEDARAWVSRAREQAAAIADPEDRAHITSQIDEITP